MANYIEASATIITAFSTFATLAGQLYSSQRKMFRSVNKVICTFFATGSHVVRDSSYSKSQRWFHYAPTNSL